MEFVAAGIDSSVRRSIFEFSVIAGMFAFEWKMQLIIVIIDGVMHSPDTIYLKQ